MVVIIVDNLVEEREERIDIENSIRVESERRIEENVEICWVLDDGDREGIENIKGEVGWVNA